MMEMTLTSTTTTTTTTTGTKSPEEEMETPPRVLVQHPIKPISYTNGVLKRTSPNRNPTPAHGTGHYYKECLKNHAATIGGHALDGCGEFMPAPTANPLDPTSLKCAACGCHRNFHRREPEDRVAAPTPTATVPVIEYHPHHRHHPLPPPSITANHPTANNHNNNQQAQTTSGSQSPPPISSSYAPHMLLALSHQQQQQDSGAAGGGVLHSLSSPTQTPPSRKRYRTKFTQDQKDKMYDFAEKVGWKMHKSNEDMVNGFCNDIGVERGVFKVWMHNNKNTFGKRSTSSGNCINLGVNNVNGSSSDDVNYHHNHHHQEEEDGEDQLQHQHHHHQQYNGKSYESNNNNTNTNANSSGIISNINNPPTNGSSSS